MKFPAWYGIVVGCLMIVQWILSILTGGVPEFQSEPRRIAFHLAAEFVTAILLIIGGITMIRPAPWSRTVLLVGLGMLIYSEIISPGYFVQRGGWSMMGMFMILLGGAIWSVLLLVRGNPAKGVSYDRAA